MKNKNKFDILNHDILHDNVLVRAITGEELERTSKLVDVEQYEDKPEWGEVISTGNGRILESGQLSPMNVKPGDIIIYGKYSSYKTRVDGKDYLIIRDEDIFTKYSI
jgi:chaperonin GroES